VSIYSFEVAGGILLLIIAIRILISGFHEKAESPESMGAVPIAIPLLVGPGAITIKSFKKRKPDILRFSKYDLLALLKSQPLREKGAR
jgi:multiple antibiotic resistance protein